MPSSCRNAAFLLDKLYGQFCHFALLLFEFAVEKNSPVFYAYTGRVTNCAFLDNKINNSYSRHTGGVITYIRSEHKSQYIYEKVFGISTWVAAISLDVKGDGKVIIACLYRSLSVSIVEFLEHLDEALETINTLGNRVVIVEDFNIGWADSNDFYRNKLKRLIIEEYDMLQLVERRTYTYNQHK